MQVRSGRRRQAGQAPSCFQCERPESNGGFSLPFLSLLLTLRWSCPGHRWLLTAWCSGPASSGLGSLERALRLQSRAEWHRTMPLALCRVTSDLSGCLALQRHLRCQASLLTHANLWSADPLWSFCFHKQLGIQESVCELATTFLLLPFDAASLNPPFQWIEILSNPHSINRIMHLSSWFYIVGVEQEGQVLTRQTT